MGIGQRGLNFIKPNESCRKDEVKQRKIFEFFNFIFHFRVGHSE
jgi:hypothetical protein